MNYLIFYLTTENNKQFTWSLHHTQQDFETVLFRQTLNGMKIIKMIKYEQYTIAIVDMENITLEEERL